MARSRWGSWRQPDSAIPFPVRGELARLGGVELWERIEYLEEQATRAALDDAQAALAAQVRVEGATWRHEVLASSRDRET